MGIDLSNNKLVGTIPAETRSPLNKLRDLQVSSNNLSGSIPEWFANISSLLELTVAYNNLQGMIPESLGKMSNLQFLQISSNNIFGTIPLPVYNLTLLEYLDVGNNELHGEIQPDIGLTLPNLKGLYVGSNHFTGQVPLSLPNASGLQDLDFANNSFSGPLPSNLGNLKWLVRLLCSSNKLTNPRDEGFSFMTSLTNCSRLLMLQISINQLEGELPLSITNLSAKLEWLALGSNMIYGNIPRGIENLKGLNRLNMSRNFITGVIPENIGKLNRLVEFDLSNNQISGAIPTSLGNMTQLTRLFLQGNSIKGSIPSDIGNCQQLEALNLSTNNLTGNIPAEAVALPLMSISFNLARNSLEGSVPQEISNMSFLLELDVSDNRLSGAIPATLSKCVMLERLDLGSNLFEGSIPFSLAALKGLHSLDLGRNKLSGQIPMYLQNFTVLQHLDLSFNNLEGEVPYRGLFHNASAITVIGNYHLCGGTKDLGLPPCKILGRKKRRRFSALRLAVLVTISCFLLLACFAIALFRGRKFRREHSSASFMEENFPRVSYPELCRATDNFSSSNLIGEGSYGLVYKGILGEERKMVEVKVLNLRKERALKSFIAECEALKNIRHRNLVKIITVCSSIDSEGADFRALVYEFMQNGSLEKWLNQYDEQPEIRKYEDQPDVRNHILVQRLNIAIDVASAIDYLHNHCETSIVHGDVKPSNVLLDHAMTAHLGDFGLARLLPRTLPDNCLQSQSSTSAVKGTVGYVPPEYAMGGQASMPGDVYSFGVLVLEMFTGKRPTDHMFNDGMTLQGYAKAVVDGGRVEDIEELSLVQEAQAHDIHGEIVESSRAHFSRESAESSKAAMSKRDCLLDVLRIGVLCSMESPGERMEMEDVVAQLSKIRAKFLRKEARA